MNSSDNFDSATHNSTLTSSEDAGKQKKNEIVSFLLSLAWLFAIVFLVVRPTLLEPFQIPSGSMIPTLEIGDRILVNKLSYGIRLPFLTNTVYRYAMPQRGDVVVFTRPDEKRTPLEDESAINIIKRVVGLPGDTIQVKGTTLYLNGAPHEEPYARYDEGGNEQGDFGPATVPEGHIFLMGDNRDHSKDGRFWEEHFLDVNRVKGRAFLIYWSWYDFKRTLSAIR